MAQFESNEVDRLSYTTGGGCLMLFGAPFLLTGVGVMIAGVVNLPSTGFGAALAQLLFGSVFALLGSGFVFGRAGVVIDKLSGTVTRWWGLLGLPLYAKSQQIKSYETVAVTKEQRGSGSGRYTAYPVVLAGPEKLEVAEPRDEIEARRKAEQIAKFLQLDLVDSIAGNSVRRKPDELDQSLRERLKPEALSIEAPPPGMRSSFSAEGNRVIFQIPPRTFRKVLLAPLFGVVLFALVVYFMFLRDVLGTNMDTTFKWVFGGLVFFFFMFLPFMAVFVVVLAQLSTRKTVEADPEMLIVRTKGLLFTTREELSSDKLEELRLDTQEEACLLALSDQKAIRFGQGLAKDELEWMRKVLMKALSA